MTAPGQDAAVLPASQVAELIQSLVKALRAFQMYLPNNPIYQRAQANVRSAFEPVWAATNELVLSVAETDFVWEEQTVYHQLSKSESLAWLLYKDGLRVLTIRSGAEAEEILQFLELVNRVRFLPPDAADDLLTLLWEREFQFLHYVFAEPFSDAEVLTPSEAANGRPPEEHRALVEEEAPSAAALVDLDDFDGTLYFLDESEINYIVDEVRREYERDTRQSALDILFDLYELEQEPAVRSEILSILDALFPNLLNAGDFRVVAGILRELRSLASSASPPEDRSALSAFEQSLSQPAIVQQLIQSLDESGIREGDDDVREVLSELQGAALEPILTMMPRLRVSSIATMLEETVDRLARAHSSDFARLLEARDHEALNSAIAVCARLKLQGTVTALGSLLDHQEASTRLAVVQALTAIGTAGALAHLDRALDDDDREVRIAAARAVASRGYRNALRRVQAVVERRNRDEMDLTERRAFFEAYGAVGGAGVVKPLAAILEGRGLLRMKESADTRACAALALGKVGTRDARAILERAAEDKDLVVRNAARSALREGTWT